MTAIAPARTAPWFDESTPYPARLRAAWAAHLAPREPGAPTVVSLFAGCGGSSLGYSMAGYRELLAVEWDDHAAATFRANFPDVPMHHGDIAAIGDAEALSRTGMSPGELDVLDGSPPCQGFSTARGHAGSRRIEDPRNSLFRQYVRLLEAWQPKALVMENVSGMVKGKMRLVFRDILAALKGAGYEVSARLLDARYFGVPQMRRRLIFVGVRRDLMALGVPGPSHPAPTVMRTVTVADAFDGVTSEPVPPLTPKYRRYAPLIRPGESCGDHDPTGKGYQDLTRLRWERVAYTVTKVNNGRGFGTPMHPSEQRSVSIPECKRIMSFPDEFALSGSFDQRWGRLGNSVPPLFMAAIAAHVRESILRA